MKLAVAVFLSLCALAISASTGGYQYPYKFEKNVHEYEKQILPLFYHVNQPSFYKEHIDIYHSFHFYDHENAYTNKEAFTHFYEMYKYHYFLNKGEIFSIFYHDHLEQAIALFKLFYYAKDFETFYKTAVWAKFHMNEGLYLYALSVAVVHRPDLYGVVLPPIYEIYPYYFFNTEVIQEAYKYKQWYKGVPADYYQDHKVKGVDGYVIFSNYSGYYLNEHPEQSLSYFLEDIGINSYYYYYNIYYPYWMSGKEFQWKDHFYRGEQYYYFHQQLLARYYLERLSNGFGQIPHFDWEVPVETYYYPSLQYPNGYEFPSRPKFAHLYEYFYNYGQHYSWRNKYAYSYTFVQQYEDRILDAIDKGYAYTYDNQHVALYDKENFYSHKGFNYLGNLIEGNYDSPHYKYYGSIQTYARHLLGYSFQPYDYHKVAPSALEHFETSLRDPMFYQFYKKVTHYFQHYKSYLPSYTEKDLYWEGVSVDKVEFDRLITYFDDFYSDISNAVYFTPEEYNQHNFHVYVHQHRLNHKPFDYKVYVKSDKSSKAVVKVFLGPKYDEYYRPINISEHNYDFVEFDHFVYDLKAGENVITRSSYESHFYGYDYTSYKDLYKMVMGASSDFTYDWKKSYFHFPQRFMLPKGTYNGFPYQFFVFVYPYSEYEGYGTQKGDQYYPFVGTGNPYFFVDKYPLGYPFDRTIKYEHMWYHIPNGYFYETKIYHKHFNDVNVQH